MVLHIQGITTRAMKSVNIFKGEKIHIKCYISRDHLLSGLSKSYVKQSSFVMFSIVNKEELRIYIEKQNYCFLLIINRLKPLID